MEHIIKEQTGIGDDNAFHRRMSDISFMPQCHIFQSGLSVAAKNTGKTRDAFRGNGVLFMRHGGRAFLTFGERFFGFKNIGTLKVADFGRHFFKAAADHGQGREEFGVAVSLNDLGGNGFRFQSQTAADAFFHTGIDVGEGAHGAGDHADGNRFFGRFQTFDGAVHFHDIQSHFQTESNGFGMDAVGTAGHDGQFMFFGETRENFTEFFHFGQQDIAAFLHLQSKSGIEHIGGSHPHMNVFGIFSDIFADGSEESDDIVFHHFFDLGDALNIEIGFFTNVFRGFFRNVAQFRHGFGSANLHFHHLAKTVFLFPDGLHLR